MNNHNQFPHNQGFPSPEEIAQSPEQPPVLGPTFTAPDMTVPELQAGDLQHPMLEPEARMTTRPGDLDPQAMQVLHDDMTYQQLDGEAYPQVYMDANGVNSRRRRDFTLLMRGLDAEESGEAL